MKVHTIALLVAALIAVPCSSLSKDVKEQTINLSLINIPQSGRFTNLEYGIRLNVQDNRSDNRLIQIYDASVKKKPAVRSNPVISSFVPEGMRRYMRTIGFNMDADAATDYLMQVTIKEFHTDWLSGIGWNGTVVMDIKVYDHNHTVIYPNTEVHGRASVNGDAKTILPAQEAINKAFSNALDDIDWDRIAFFLHRSNDPSKEGNKQVKGEGNTALEHLVLHFNINSRPQGADIDWRIVSKTPEVKNQNYKYLETTPYESSETLSIPGLTFNNSGLVEIEIRVSKKGYNSQVKKFNVRSLIDEKEVSGMWRLVPEDEE